jgi:hypothetical protein
VSLENTQVLTVVVVQFYIYPPMNKFNVPMSSVLPQPSTYGVRGWRPTTPPYPRMGSVDGWGRTHPNTMSPLGNFAESQ